MINLGLDTFNMRIFLEVTVQLQLQWLLIIIEIILVTRDQCLTILSSAFLVFCILDVLESI